MRPPSYLSLAVFAGLGLLIENPAARAEQSPTRARPVVMTIRLENQAINPVTARFIRRAIGQAEQDQAECLIVVLDTPGGLVDSTRSIVRDMLGSEVPIVVFVAPSGARAASAGMFITLAAHVAAMAPGTNIGSAYPVQIGSLPGSPPQKEDAEDSPSTPMVEKSVNDTVAWARALAEMRGRNADWAADAVRESASAMASEAVAEGAVDLSAKDLEDLLARIDGREVTLPKRAVRLDTKSAELRTLEMWWGERILTILANPNVAFLLLIFGFYGILFELYSPGWGIAGTFGIVCLLLSFSGLAILPVNYVGLALLAVALAVFVAEAFITSYGALTVAGIVCLVLGGTMLVDSPAGFQQISLAVIVPVGLATAVITVLLVSSVVKTHRGRVQTGSAALASAAAVALEDFSPELEGYSGAVRVQGEIWKAVSSAPVNAGQPLDVVEERDGLILEVQAIEAAHSSRSLPDRTKQPTKE